MDSIANLVGIAGNLLACSTRCEVCNDVKVIVAWFLSQGPGERCIIALQPEATWLRR